MEDGQWLIQENLNQIKVNLTLNQNQNNVNSMLPNNPESI